MAFDGAFLYKTVAELRQAVDCHIDKIHQPSREELVFLLRKKGFAGRLLITVKSGAARIQLTENKYENPQTPPNFCMLLRKYLASARLADIIQPGLERVAELVFYASDEMGDTVKLRLICELIGNRSNVILVKESGEIIDSLRHSDVEAVFSEAASENGKRVILPGAVYEYPPSQNKINPLLCDSEHFSDGDIRFDGDLSKELLNKFDGLSPLVCREAEYLTRKAIGVGASPQKALNGALEAVVDGIKTTSEVYLVCNTDGTPLDFSYIEIKQYDEKSRCVPYGSCSQLLDAFYTAKETAARIKTASHDITRLVTNLRSRTEKKLALRLDELKKCENRDTLRIYGELLKANLYAIENGSRFAEVPNYYDENLKTVKIPLNPAISPAKNAEKYFKDYKKTYSAQQALTVLTEKDREELVYFDSVLDSISRCENVSEISEIREELILEGYLKANGASGKKQKPKNDGFKEFTSREGYRILVGKNNIQNDIITTRLASKNDLWFHTKSIPGSHVVIFSGGAPISDETLFAAASLAAENSKAAASSNIPVDYTYIKNVKKPSGAKPGMVIYTSNKTLFVTPGGNKKPL